MILICNLFKNKYNGLRKRFEMNVKFRLSGKEQVRIFTENKIRIILFLILLSIEITAGSNVIQAGATLYPTVIQKSKTKFSPEPLQLRPPP